ncbi:MAG: hypothetical protein ABJA10_09735, partial [Aestuariivirga sp.]
MQGFGVHTSMWTMKWDRAGAEKAVAAAVHYKMDFIEIALLNAPNVDTAHSRALLEKNNMKAVCSLGLPEAVWASRNPEGAIEHLKIAVLKLVPAFKIVLAAIDLKFQAIAVGFVGLLKKGMAEAMPDLPYFR